MAKIEDHYDNILAAVQAAEDDGIQVEIRANECCCLEKKPELTLYLHDDNGVEELSIQLEEY